MKKRTVISFGILFVLTILIIGLSIGSPDIWIKFLSHWIILPSIAIIMTLLIGLVLMDDLFELDDSTIIRAKKSKLRIGVKKYLIWAFLIVCFISVILELVQFFLSKSSASLLDPLTIIAGAIFGIILHAIGAKLLMKRVEFELERWEDNVL